MAWIDMWTGVWSALWGTDVPDPNEMGDFYNTQVEIYADTAFGTLTDIINARTEPSTLSELKGHGAGSFKVSKNDPKVAKNPQLLDYRNYVKIRLNGMVIGGFIIQTKKTVIIGAGEERDETWEVSGEGPRSWVRDASVYPAKGLKNSSAETRYFNFSTEQGSWYTPGDWVYATMRWAWNNVSNGAPKGHAPANWPDAPGARWIWNSPYDGTDPQGFCYFRHEFTVSGTAGTVKSYAFFIAADDAAEVYVDGEQKAIIEQPGWHDTTRVEMELEPGPHVIGVKAYNYSSTGPGEILTALFTYGDPAAPTPATLVNHSGMANTWRVNGYPAVEPGWTVGDVLITLLNEAKARGVRFANNFTPTFSGNTDSAGTPWTEPVPWSFEIGTTYEDVISAAEELGCDVYVDPDTLEMHVWTKRGADRSLNGLLKGPLVEGARNIYTNPQFIDGSVNNLYNGATETWGGGILTVTQGTNNATLAGMLYPVPTAAGLPWSAKMQVRRKPGMTTTRTLRIVPTSYNAGSGVAWTQVGTPATITLTLADDNWQDVEFSDFIQGATANNVGVQFQPQGTFPAGEGYQVRRVIMSNTQVAPDYFDGDSVDTQTPLATYRWASTPGASASIMDVPSSFGDVVIFSPGHNLVAADETGQAQIANTLMLRTPEGWTEKTPQDSTSITKYGRVETQMSTKLTTQGANTLVTELFRQKSLPEVSATFDIVPVPGMIPFLNFNVGDWVSAPGEIPGVKESRRVMSIAFTEDAETGLPLYAVEFDTIFKDRQTELERWLSRVANSSAIGGGFTNSSTLPPTVIVTPPGTPGGVIPDAPTGLVVSSVGKWLPDGGSSSDYGLTWNAVVTGSGFGSVEISQYEVWGRLVTESESHLIAVVFDTFAYLPGFRPGDEWAFKIRAISRSGGPGNFSTEVSLVADAPETPLSPPWPPTLTSSFGSVSIGWNGQVGIPPASSPVPAYVRYIRVQRSAVGAGVYSNIGTIPANSSIQSITDRPGPAGTSWDYRLIAVDGYGNASPPSAATNVIVQGVNSGDIAGGLASNNLVANGSFEDGFSPFWKVVTKHPGSSSGVVSTGSFNGAKYLLMQRATELEGEEVELAIGQADAYYIPISSVGDYGYFVSAKAASQLASQPGNFSLRAYWWQADKVTPASTAFSSAVDTVDLTSTAAYFTGRVYPPDDARFLQVVIVNDMANTVIYVDDIVAREAITPNMLGENVILAEHMSAGSVTTNALQANSVTTDILSAEAVTADNIAAGAIQVSHLSPSVGSSIDISANSSVNILINRADQLEADLDSTAGDVEDLKTYYSFGPDGAIIGQTDSAFKLFLKNDRIEILENGNVVSYWDSGRMVVPSFVGEEVVLGNHKLEKEGGGTVVRAI